MNFVLVTGISPSRLPPPRLAPEQVNCGPGFEDVAVADRILSLRTPRGVFDVASLVRRLSRRQQPDALAVLVDFRGAAWPRGLERISCPKVLLVAEVPPVKDFIVRLAEYVRHEPFDQVILLSDRRSAVWLRDEGVRNAAWLPGWLFPHSDAEVGLSRGARRDLGVAVCIRPGTDERQLLRLTAALAQRALPVHPRMPPEQEVPAHFGSSALALIDSGAGGLELRPFQALAAGAAVLCGRPAGDSGWESVWPEQPFSVFEGREPLIERVKHLIAHPEEARTLGEKGTRWFADRFSAHYRQRVFAALVFDHRAQPEFALPEGATISVANPEPAAGPARGVETVPEAEEKLAQESLEAGDRPKALELARVGLKKNDASWRSLLVLAELALDGGKADLTGRMLAKARVLVPDDEHLARLELGSRIFLKDWRVAEALARAWQAWENREWVSATKLASRVLSHSDRSADTFLVAGRAGVMLARRENLWVQYGKMLNHLLLAAETNPRRPDLWHELAVARRIAGGVLPDAVAAYRAALELDSERLEDWFGLGEALMALGEADGAAAAFAEALRRAPQSLGISDWLGHVRKRQGRLLEAEVCHRRGFGVAGSARLRAGGVRPGLRRAVFVLQNGHGWPCWSSVYDEFVRDPSWETVVVGLPWLHPSFANSSHKDQDKVFDFLAEKGIPHVRWTDFPLTENAADLVFLQNPYDSTRPDGWKVAELVGAGHRLCYVPYGIEIGSSREGLEYQFDMGLHRYAWAIFARSEAHRALFGRHCLAGNRHVAVTGHPKFDDLGRSNGIEADPELVSFARGRPLVLWNPHFDARLNGTRFGDGFSTFLRWRDFLLQEIGRRPELAFVIRPHPNFFSVLEERGLMTRVQRDRFLGQCAAAGIFLHRSAAYFPLLAAADAILSDGSSLLIEFGITGKPVCYLHNPDGQMAHLDYELDFDFVRQHFWWATEEGQIRSFLDRLPDALSDHAGRELRAAELRRRMGVGDEPIGCRIKREIQQRLTDDGADACGAAHPPAQGVTTSGIKP